MKYTVDIDPRVKTSNEEVIKSWNFPVMVKMVGEINEESGKIFREHVEQAENEAKISQQEVLPIIIDSYGGCPYEALGIIDAMENCSVKIATIVESKAMSAAAFIYSFGDPNFRFVGPNATIMIHPLSAKYEGKLPDLKADVVENDRLNKKIFSLLAKNCKQKKEDYFMELLKQHNMADLYFTPEEAVKHGLASHIGIPEYRVKVSIEHEFVISDIYKKGK